MINRVFCIDDDQITLTLCDLVLKKASFAEEILVAKNGKEGLIFFSDYFSFNFIICSMAKTIIRYTCINNNL